jgi:glycosyltransferase involved in cell wall biosynthesis
MELHLQRKERKIRILVEGWINIPHSYAIVNCLQLVQLAKLGELELYIKEAPYFKESWNQTKKLMYGSEYNAILTGLKEWKGEEVDIIYRISYPYNISVESRNDNIPTFVFFTSEFATLDVNYFALTAPFYKFIDDNTITSHFERYRNLHFITPSDWSKKGMDKYITDKTRISVIPHGVDTSLFRRNSNKRNSIRKIYGFEEDDIVLMNIGSMTRNKGIVEILMAMKLLVFDCKLESIKLILKGTQDLYESRKFVETYMTSMIDQKYITKEESNHILDKHVVFTEKTLSFNVLNDLYNAADAYISPYLAEGFNLTVLEALTVGLPVIVSGKGSTEGYVEDIIENCKGADRYIRKVPCEIMNVQGRMMNRINVVDLVKVIAKDIEKLRPIPGKDYDDIFKFIETKYSWKAVALQLCDVWKKSIL